MAPGLYEQLITESLETELAEIAGELVERQPVHKAEAAAGRRCHASSGSIE